MHLTKLEINMTYFVETIQTYMLSLCLLRYLLNLKVLTENSIEIRDQDMPAPSLTRPRGFEINLVVVEGNLQMPNRFFGHLLCMLLLECIDLELVLHRIDNHTCLLVGMVNHCKRLKLFGNR